MDSAGRGLFINGSELTKAAENFNVRIGIENAHMYGHWYAPSCNIGFCPRAWEMLFDAVNSDNLGLEWEPSHQLEQLGDPLAQLKRWLPKIVHVHGKDAVIDREHIKKYGAWFGESYCVHRFPGFGECDWREIIQILSNYGYKSDICIEGFMSFPSFRRLFLGLRQHINSYGWRSIYEYLSKSLLYRCLRKCPQIC